MALDPPDFNQRVRALRDAEGIDVFTARARVAKHDRLTALAATRDSIKRYGPRKDNLLQLCDIVGELINGPS